MNKQITTEEVYPTSKVLLSLLEGRGKTIVDVEIGGRVMGPYHPRVVYEQLPYVQPPLSVYRLPLSPH